MGAWASTPSSPSGAWHRAAYSKAGARPGLLPLLGGSRARESSLDSSTQAAGQNLTSHPQGLAFLESTVWRVQWLLLGAEPPRQDAGE